MRWTFTLIKRFLPVGIPVVLVATSAVVFELQNYSKLTPKEPFLLKQDDQLAVQYKTYVSGDPKPKEFIGPEYSIPVARKTLLTRHAGLRFYDRGHGISFEAELPEFLSESPFLKKLSQQLCDDFRKSASEFTQVDWSIVLEGFREPSYSQSQWDGMIGVDFAHVTPNAVSLIQSYWEYTGGAHGNGGLDGQSYVDDQGTVQRLKLEDLFDANSDWKKRLVDFCVRDLRHQGASYVSAALVENPSSPKLSEADRHQQPAKLSFDDDDDPFSESSDPAMETAKENYLSLKQFSTDDLTSFTLSPPGIRFYFSPYHVGSYADGVFTVGVPYDVIRDCIPETSPARLFMKANAP